MCEVCDLSFRIAIFFIDNQMRTSKPILILLVMTILASGLPIFMQADVSRDSRIDLEDVIIWIKGFVQTAEKPANFQNNVYRLISSFEVVAGLKHIIQPDIPKLVHHSALDFPFIISVFQFPWFNLYGPYLIELKKTYRSHVIIPDTPPPRGYS